MKMKLTDVLVGLQQPHYPKRKGSDERPSRQND